MSSDKTVDIRITPQIAHVINTVREIKRNYGVISPHLFTTQKGKPYSKSGLISMGKRAKKRAGITEEIWFKDIRSLGATDAAKAGSQIKGIQTRLVHTCSRTSEIYIKESVPEKSKIEAKLLWGK